MPSYIHNKEAVELLVVHHGDRRAKGGARYAVIERVVLADLEELAHGQEQGIGLCRAQPAQLIPRQRAGNVRILQHAHGVVSVRYAWSIPNDLAALVHHRHRGDLVFGDFRIRPQCQVVHVACKHFLLLRKAEILQRELRHVFHVRFVRVLADPHERVTLGDDVHDALTVDIKYCKSVQVRTVHHVEHLLQCGVVADLDCVVLLRVVWEPE